jgi:uncharacterized protein (TIGR03382 family)
VRVPRRPVAVVAVVFAACVATVHTSSTQDEVIALNGSSMPTYPFGTKMVGTTSGSAVFVITEATVGGSDTVTDISLGSGCGSDFTLIAPAPLTGSANDYSGSVPIDGTCAGSAMIRRVTGGAGFGSVATCDEYTFYVTFTPHLATSYTCTGTVAYTTGGSMFSGNDFILTGSGTNGTVPTDAPADSSGSDAMMTDSGSGSGSGSGTDAGTGGSSSEKDRQTYYACSTGGPVGAAPVALALLAVRRRRKLRA